MNGGRLRRGCSYALVRKASSTIDVVFEGLWRESTKTGGTRRRLLFSATPRALSKYGRKTRPKLIIGQDYTIERPSGSLSVRLIATTKSAGGRLLVLRPRK